MHIEHHGPKSSDGSKQICTTKLGPIQLLFCKGKLNKKGIADYMTDEFFFMRTVAGNSSMRLQACGPDACKVPQKAGTCIIQVKVGIYRI